MSDEYIHGYSESEQLRLTAMQALLNQAELEALDLGGVHSLLDVGCGLGQMTRAFARRMAPGSRVIGVERDERQLREAARQAGAEGEAELVELRSGRAESLPLADGERGCFDLVHTRFLLEHVPDPLAVVREMVAAAKPGGRIVLVDDDHEALRLWPPCAEMEHAWRAYWEGYRDHGCDPLVGRRLPELLHQSGAQPRRVDGIFYGAVRGAPLFDAVVRNLAEVVEGAADGLAAGGRLSHGELTAALAAFDRWSRGPTATVWYTLPFAEGVRPE